MFAGNIGILEKRFLEYFDIGESSTNSIMYFFRFFTVPSSAHPDYETIGQSYINCWIERSALDEAYLYAKKSIREANWIVNEPEEACEVTRDFYEDDSPHLEFYERALTEKEVIVYVTSPKRSAP